MALPPTPVLFAQGTSAVSSTTYTFNVGTTTPRSGTLVVVAGSTGSNSTGVTDTQGNTYTLATQSLANQNLQVWVASNAKQLIAGTDQITVTFASANTAQKNVLAFDVPGGFALDVAVSANGSSSAPSVSGTPGFINELAICVTQCGNAGGPVPNAPGYTFFATQAPAGQEITACFYSWIPTSTAQTPAVTLPASVPWAQLLVTFRVTPVAVVPATPFFPAGYDPQQADFTTWWYENASFFQGKTVFRGVQAAAQTLTNNASSVLHIDTVLEDPYGGWVPASFGWIPPFAGYYKALICAQVAAVTTGPANITAGVGSPYSETPAQALASAAHPTGVSAEFGGYWVSGGSQLIIPIAGLWNGPAGGVSTSIAAGEQSSLEIIWLGS